MHWPRTAYAEIVLQLAACRSRARIRQVRATRKQHCPVLILGSALRNDKKAVLPIFILKPGILHSERDKDMQSTISQLYMRFANLANCEEGQDLVEYALLVCLVALAAIVGVNQVASAVTLVFSNISASLA